MMENLPTLDSLPNELLISILSQLPTSSLLPLATVSRRIYSVTLRIVKQRLNHATSQPDQRLMLECYHPSEKLYTPYLYCNYLSTDSFASAERKPGSGSSGLGSIYTHFRPVEQDEDRPRRATRGFRQHHHTTDATSNDSNSSAQEQRPSTDVYLDDDESFAQLCAVTNLVRMGPRPGMFRSHVNVSEGVLRVWRDWLAAQATGGRRRGGEQLQAEEGGDEGGEGDNDSDDHGDGDGVLWADASRDVGVRFRVTEKDIRGQHPVLVASDEQLPVAYRLEFEELLVRATTLLLMVEKSEVQEFAAEGKAVVLASF
ncbi:cyclin-like F-box protein [Chaetomium sp. MPI-CAGE-AT-0009]|nr:cyclin-like F-box protein [Chaetomium sp. MPI-CAGE-AT-0009]